MPKVSNQTNDPQMVNSRVFVGNLNTFAVTKEDVERLFKRYGRIFGISMHKGYAFVQFCNEYDGRNAVAGEEGRVVAGQALDVNMASEPKPNRPTKGGSTGVVNDWDYFYDTGYSHAPPTMHGPPMKRPRSDALTVRRELVPVRQKGKAAKRQPVNSTGLFVEYNASDVVICGNCKEQFADLESMLIHRKTRCKFRFACKCQEIADKTAMEVGPFHCASCEEVFPNLWDVVFHAQNSHNIKVVDEELPEKKTAEEQDNVVEGAGNHEGEASGDIAQSGDGNDGEGEFENDEESAVLQDAQEGEAVE